MNKTKLWKFIGNLGLVGICIGGIVFGISQLFNIFMFCSVVYGIAGIVFLLSGEEGRVPFSKEMAKIKVKGESLPDTINNIFWAILILVPVAYSHIFIGICWGLMWLFIGSCTSLTEEYYQEYKLAEEE